MAQRENISGTVCAKRDGKESTEKKASGGTGVSWDVSGLNHHDRIVNQKAERNDECIKRQAIDREARKAHNT